MRATTEQRARVAAGFARLIELAPRWLAEYRTCGRQERARWDAFRFIQRLDGFHNLSRDLYRAGLNDSHIDTILRSTIAALTATKHR